MSNLQRQIASALAEDLEPVKADEVVKPIRLVWTAPNGMVRAQVFPTVDRALKAAEGKKNARLMDINEPVPQQNPYLYKNRFYIHVNFRAKTGSKLAEHRKKGQSESTSGSSVAPTHASKPNPAR